MSLVPGPTLRARWGSLAFFYFLAGPLGLVTAGCSQATASSHEGDAAHLPDAGKADVSAPPPPRVADAAKDVPAVGWPPHCDPGVGVPEDTVSLGGHVTLPPGGTPGCSADGTLCAMDVSFTPTQSDVIRGGVDTFTFAGPIDEGGTASIGIQLDSSRLSVDSLVGVPIRLQTWGKSLDCTAPNWGDVQGEQLSTGQVVLRDGSGSVLLADGISVLTPGGVLVYGADSLPELKLEWVTKPDEDCVYRQVALKMTVVKTGATAFAQWERPSKVQIGGSGYSFLALGVLEVPTGRGVSGAWVLVRDGFLHAVGASQ